jgi:beta-galactosidase/beta-glucuronidase
MKQSKLVPSEIHHTVHQTRQKWFSGRVFVLALGVGAFLGASAGVYAQQPDAVLPPGVKAVWDVDKAYHETTPTREKICLNGLWQWQPGVAGSQSLPTNNWGYFKVPGCWPGLNRFLIRDSQKVYANPAWSSRNYSAADAAWYRREFRVPENWRDRRIALRVEYLNSVAKVYVDGKAAGEIHFPGGELDITSACAPGAAHSLAVHVVATPLSKTLTSFIDSAVARQVQGSVERKGLCGDVYLLSTPKGPRLTDIRIGPSVRKQECTFDTAIDGLAPEMTYRLEASVSQEGRNSKTITSAPFKGSALKEGRIAFTAKWMPDRLWDTITPQNFCTLKLSLQDAAGKDLDIGWPQRFGFRELWIDGRDFYLNGTRIYLSAAPLDNGQLSTEMASYGPARETMRRLKSFGINFVFTHHYSCDPGAHLGLEEIMRAADDEGMLVSLSQPHFRHYNWDGANAELTNGYARHAEFYVRAAQNHPSVVMYSMSHNAGGYSQDMNPEMIDGIQDPRVGDAARLEANALRAQAIVEHFDPSRPVYHHASGNLGSMYTINFYPNFVPAQELDDWFGHWATKGVKPVFTCEYGAPSAWDWTMYRGWYKGTRAFGNAYAQWEFCVAEWNSQFWGDRAFQISQPEKEDLRWEAGQYAAGKTWQRYSYPNQVSSDRFDERFPVYALYLHENFRAYRTWGVAAISPWEFAHFWKMRKGANTATENLKVDWDHLQRPGFSPDFASHMDPRRDTDLDLSDWVATPAAETLLRDNMPLLAYIGGKAAAFTGKDHNFQPGETVEKQLIIINNSRQSVMCDCQWSLDLPEAQTGSEKITLATGQQKRIALDFKLPATLAAGSHELNATVKFSNGETQKDNFAIHIMPAPAVARVGGKVALYDPKGETGTWLNKLGITSEPVTADSDLTGYDMLIVGKEALYAGAGAPDISRVRDGLKVIVFEQTADTLEKRFGFRVEEYGLRKLFARVPGHPCLAGIDASNLCDWRGEATLTPPRLKYESRPGYPPQIRWCGILENHAWRCGNRGNVASVLIEKPTRGNFLPVVDGGFSLQFSPLLEFREGKGLVMFCQMDVTGRTETEPAAETLTRNLLEYVSGWKPSPGHKVVYAGPAAGKSHLESLGIPVRPYDGGTLSGDQVFVLGKGAGAALADHPSAVADWLKAGGNVLAIGLEQKDASALFPFNVTMKEEEHIAAYFEPDGSKPLLAGVCSADVQNHAPRKMPLVTAGARIAGDGVLAQADNANVVFFQMEPWQFSATNQMNMRRTFRRTSFAESRLLANMGVSGVTPLLDRFHQPVHVATEKRWLTGFYLDMPQDWDDPYRFFRW